MIRPGKSGTVYARLSAQGINLEARIIGNTIETITVKYPLSLGKCIAFESVGIFRDIVVATYIGQSDHTIAAGEHTPKFAKLVGIVCRKDQLLHDLY